MSYPELIITAIKLHDLKTWHLMNFNKGLDDQFTDHMATEFRLLVEQIDQLKKKQLLERI